MAILVPRLKALRQEITSVAPNRDTESDGWIGNQNHQTYASGHNPDETGLSEIQDSDDTDEVRAIDVDADLRQPGLTMQMIADYLRLECRAGRIDWIYYIIWNEYIASNVDNWKWRDYNGSNPHTKHMHVSGNLKSDLPATKTVGLLTLLEEKVTPEDIEKIAKAVEERVWNHQETNALSGKPSRMGTVLAWQDFVHEHQSNRVMTTLAEAMALQSSNPEEIRQLLPSPEAIASAVLVYLTPEKIAEAIPEELASQVVDILVERLQD